LADVVGPFFLTYPEEAFSLDRFHPSATGYRRTAKALVPSVLMALGERAEPPPGHRPPFPFPDLHPGPRWASKRPGRSAG
jgi:hypothetical protein